MRHIKNFRLFESELDEQTKTGPYIREDINILARLVRNAVKLEDKELIEKLAWQIAKRRHTGEDFSRLEELVNKELEIQGFSPEKLESVKSEKGMYPLGDLVAWTWDKDFDLTGSVMDLHREDNFWKDLGKKRAIELMTGELSDEIKLRLEEEVMMDNYINDNYMNDKILQDKGIVPPNNYKTTDFDKWVSKKGDRKFDILWDKNTSYYRTNQTKGLPKSV